ncbi:MAG: fibronectin type III domain-containing protein [Ignavibacteriae bacterium]|nr:fibronectin type III domain-containing protein [Ignavibacteriota bacterium]
MNKIIRNNFLNTNNFFSLYIKIIFLVTFFYVSCAEWSSEPENTLNDGKKIQITYPKSGDVVSEGLVNIYYNVNQPYSTKFLELYINGKFIKNIPPNSDGSLPPVNYFFDSTQVNKTYNLLIIFYDNEGKSYKSNLISDLTVIKDNRPPFRPYNVRLINFNNGTCNISWMDSSKHIEQYELWRKQDLEGEYLLHQKLSGTSFNTNDNGLDSNKTYYYKVRGVKSSGISEFSNEVNTSGISSTGDLLPATNLTLQILEDFSIQINWTDNSDNENYFSVERSTDNNLFSSVAYLPPNSTQYIDSKNGLTLGMTYFYRIKNFSNSDSAVSPVASIVLNSVILNPPTNLSADYDSTVPVVELRWKNNDNRILFFDIERKTENGNFALLKRVNAGNNLYLDFSILSQRNYTYRVRGFDSIRYSDYSNEVVVSTY